MLSLVKMFNANISGNAETFGLSKATGYSAQNCFREQRCHLITSGVAAGEVILQFNRVTTL